jgi:hypothetical protein
MKRCRDRELTVHVSNNMAAQYIKQDRQTDILRNISKTPSISGVG